MWFFGPSIEYPDTIDEEFLEELKELTESGQEGKGWNKSFFDRTGRRQA